MRRPASLSKLLGEGHRLDAPGLSVNRRLPLCIRDDRQFPAPAGKGHNQGRDKRRATDDNQRPGVSPHDDVRVRRLDVSISMGDKGVCARHGRRRLPEKEVEADS